MVYVEIYVKQTCPYCVRAKALLTQKGVAFTEYDLATDPDLSQTMKTRAEGRQTVPQIFIDNQAIGGCDDLYALDNAGKLDRLLISK